MSNNHQNRQFSNQINWDLIFQELENSGNGKLLDYFAKLKSAQVRIDLVKDEKQFNLVHHAVLKGQEGKVDFLIQTAKQLFQLSSAQIKEWVNAVTDKDKFTPLHFASYKCQLDAINTLLRFGADKDALTATELNMLHVAAQGDSASSLFLFKELGLNINAADKRGSTPLHWACFRQSEIALGYLLAWGP